MDLLDHEVLVAALLGSAGVPRDLEDLALDGLAADGGQRDAVLRQHGHVAVFENHELSGVPEQRRDVGGDVVLALADAEDERAVLARGDQDAGRVSCEMTPIAYEPSISLTASRTASSKIALEVLLDQVGDDFGVGLGLEDVALPSISSSRSSR